MATGSFNFLFTVKHCLFTGQKMRENYNTLSGFRFCETGLFVNMAMLFFLIITWVLLTWAVRTCNQCKDLPIISSVYVYYMIIVQGFLVIMSNKLYRFRVRFQFHYIIMNYRKFYHVRSGIKCWIYSLILLLICVPEAGIKDRDKELPPTWSVGCNYLSTTLIPSSGYGRQSFGYKLVSFRIGRSSPCHSGLLN